MVERMRLLGGTSLRGAETVVAADSVRQGIESARNATDVTLHVDYRVHDEESTVRIDPWELDEVARQLLANAVDAMGPGGRIVVSLDRTKLNA